LYNVVTIVNDSTLYFENAKRVDFKYSKHTKRYYEEIHVSSPD
jgi:hypothetical protein